ncbi:Rrf2 family transcriptional regulator [Streptococcus caviae]|uniref:Rrf2 family transcriptional regulator n=1 Tax=Streptococcus sp. 'caviae' TaxID=1915004 RepID=UPI00094B8EDB|nr:Rrf2 family transcriptional regulator [Streptococcus sp. 'caviae']OLN84088.1 hypothetical protein BMI76_02495 [Streptococcus sp. 'caviae']
MKQSVQFSDAIHIMVYVSCTSNPDFLKSEMIAASIQTNASNVRKIMSNLRRAGLIISQRGKAQPRLAKDSSEITLLDIFESLPSHNTLLQVDRNTNADCIIASGVKEVLTARYQEIQEAAEKAMAQISLSDIMADFSQIAVQRYPQFAEELSRFLPD